MIFRLVPLPSTALVRSRRERTEPMTDTPVNRAVRRATLEQVAGAAGWLRIEDQWLKRGRSRLRASAVLERLSSWCPPHGLSFVDTLASTVDYRLTISQSVWVSLSSSWGP